MGNSFDDDLLYIRTDCTACLGGIRKGVFVNCPYCDIDRKSLIEAPFSVIKESLKKSLSKEQKKELTDFLNDEG